MKGGLTALRLKVYEDRALHTSQIKLALRSTTYTRETFSTACLLSSDYLLFFFFSSIHFIVLSLFTQTDKKLWQEWNTIVVVWMYSYEYQPSLHWPFLWEKEILRASSESKRKSYLMVSNGISGLKHLPSFTQKYLGIFTDTSCTFLISSLLKKILERYTNTKLQKCSLSSQGSQHNSISNTSSGLTFGSKDFSLWLLIHVALCREDYANAKWH